MNNENAGGVIIILFGLLCGLPMLLILLAALMTRFLERAKGMLLAHPWQSFFLGLVNTLFFLAIGLLFAEVGFVPLKAMAFLSLFIALPIIIMMGLAVAVGLVGERVLTLFTQKSGVPIVTLIVGIIFLGFSALTPIVGWALLVILIIMGFGATLLALFRRSETIEPPIVEPMGTSAEQ